MKVLNTQETHVVAGASFGTYLMETIYGPIPWGLGHAFQYIDTPTFLAGAVVGGMATTCVLTTTYCLLQNSHLRQQNNMLMANMANAQITPVVVR